MGRCAVHITVRSVCLCALSDMKWKLAYQSNVPFVFCRLCRPRREKFEHGQHDVCYVCMLCAVSAIPFLILLIIQAACFFVCARCLPFRGTVKGTQNGALFVLFVYGVGHAMGVQAYQHSSVHCLCAVSAARVKLQPTNNSVCVWI